MPAAQEVQISIAEVIEVRGYGLNAPELLSVAVSAADRLPPCPKGTVFDTENVFLNSKGELVIKTVATSRVDRSFVPPEWAKGEEDAQAAAVYCLGAVLRAAGAEEAADVDLFSLVNILTVAMTGTRPTAHRMGQMARNQLRGRDPASMLMCIYEELMGDEDTNQIDVDIDDLDDDFLSTNGMERHGSELQGEVVFTTTSTANNNVKRAVEYFEDDNQDDALTSTSSGNSTQKESSPFTDFDDVPPPPVAPETPAPAQNRRESASPERQFLDESHLGGIGSPLSQSTRLDETFIEEYSIELDTSGKNNISSAASPGPKSPFDDDFTDTAAPVAPPPAPTKAAEEYRRQPHQNPFDEEEEEESQFGGGTLSGRDPFDEDSGNSNENQLREKKLHKKEQLAHRLSSSSEEIVEASIHEDEPIVMAQIPEEKPKPKAIPAFDNAYDADFDNSPPLHHYSAVHLETGLSPLEEAQRALRANRARHKPSNVSLAEEAKLAARQRYSNASDIRREEEEEVVEEDPAVVVPVLRKDLEVEEAPKSVRPPRYRKSREIEEPVVVDRFVEEEVDEKEDIDAIFEKYRKTSVSADPKSHTPILMADEYKEPQKQVPAPVVVAQESPILKRRNSLVPSRISGRQSTRRSVTSVRSMRGKRKTRAIPEFFDLTRHQNIRLRAPATKKKRISLHRVEDTEVVVELLNGQKVEVACRSDVISRDVFSLIVQNMNINEHVFFGLSFLRDGEHYFIEDHQRLEKFAPSGWKSVARVGVKVPYVLHLRFKFYPQILDFIKTDVTMNELYLQCRRDVLEERIQPKRDAAFELAALALQAEFGNRPPPVITDYFDIQHYLPKKYSSFEDQSRLKNILAELHGHYAGTRISEAKHKYIQICQRHPDFGAHVHRVFRTKPTSAHGASPFDPDTGSSLWIGIMPRGISIYEQQGGAREVIAEHVWPQTQTLQFDKKRFVIVAVGAHDEQIESTFYTDHHSKSSYFVRFAASQHRWMMKMRQWKSTLRHENTIQAMPDVIVEGQTIPPAPIRQGLEESPPSTPLLASADQIFAKMSVSQEKPAANRPAELPPPAPSSKFAAQYDTVDEGIVCDSQAENFERVDSTDNGNVTPRGMQFDILLVKDPANGLGLTLVDGNLNGVPGVYVKLVADNGAGMKAGVCVGDRIVQVGTESMEGHDRLHAVELVRRCGQRVPMVIARLDGLIRHQKDVSAEMLASAGRKKSFTSSSGDLLNAPNRTNGQSRTPPAPRKAANRRQRAVSDFGAIGDALPTLDGDNLINIKAISGLHLDESDEEKGEYRLPTTSMYAFDRDDDLQASIKESKKPAPEPKSGELRKYRYARRSNLEIAEEIEEEAVESSDDDGQIDEGKRVIDVELDRNENGSLGVQIASLSGRVCIKQLTSEPAISHPDIRVGDVLLYVNGIAVEGKVHQEVVAMLRGGGDRVVLGVQRPPPAYSDQHHASSTSASAPLISVMLLKKPMATLGLSLAKRTMSDGIFIRNIAQDSAASSEGTLRVGDRLVSLDGEPVDGFTPATILEKLKLVQGPVQITVTREQTA
ncbi:Protein kinase domain-containing protein [Caenorhabditis elegans]|uniref:Protein kinase domain-containing protein n=1 Tax=Caenorhabditis elegans TaxID=6239 RepID=Q33BL4_CAEEL|nr:Protein kinase domain-containing protein [Caenorhabditis elegans]CCD68260.2 Protein kinase domain-containing protein [Caenorhabditis elegans]|eukprot:NP_001255217.2 FERM domain (protein4.1-ezrin-radixin-moesin) family [Caenorhabditis elegans]